MQSIFAWHLGNPLPQTLTSMQVVKNIKLVDETISKAAPKWSLDQINHIDLAVLRLATWELIFAKDTPAKVVMDEAIEIAKEYGSESSSSFVNGVIGSIAKSLDCDLSFTSKDKKDNTTTDSTQIKAETTSESSSEIDKSPSESDNISS